jgi:diguanylate cyclase (GGDEF)-like protein
LVSRGLLYLSFRKKNLEGDQYTPWGERYIISIFLTGMAWGVASLFIHTTNNPTYQLVIALWIVAMSASAAVAYSIYIKAVMMFFVPSTVTLIISLFFIGGTLQTLLAIALCFYILITVSSMLPVNKSMINAIKLNYELEMEIEERKKIEEQLRELSLKDALTGLSNRRQFDEVMEREWRRAKRENSPLSFILLDIDSFKLFNDSYGHQEGDACLQRVSGVIMQEAKRPGDLTARYGGEEFAVILPNTESHHAYTIAEKIRHEIVALNIPHIGSKVEDCNIVTISSGVSTFIPGQNMTQSDIIKWADAALYKAKHEGRNRVLAS